MAFVTRLTLSSGDRELLEDVVADVKATARHKGVEFKGPHARPPTTHRVPLYKTVAADATFPDWEYAVYSRVVEIVGHEEIAREVAGRRFPAGVHVAVTVEQQRPMGS